jgi:hypothetical protein
MSQLQDLARILMAAGGHVHPERSKGVYLLYIDDTGKLVSKLWTGQDFGEMELIAESARLDSMAAYLIIPDSQSSDDDEPSRSVIYISSTSALSVARYDDDDDQWVVDDSIAQFQVHADGKVTAAADSSGNVHVFFENPSRQLIHVDSAWTPTVLSTDHVDGSPLVASLVEGTMQLFYVSASDKCVHSMLRQQNGSWTDSKLAQYAFETKPKNFLMLPDDEKALNAFALTEQNQVLWITADGKTTTLGVVDSMGKLIALTSEENVPGINCAFCRGPRCSLFDYRNLRVTHPGKSKRTE